MTKCILRRTLGKIIKKVLTKFWTAWITISPFSSNDNSSTVYFVGTPSFSVFWICFCTTIIGNFVPFERKDTLFSTCSAFLNFKKSLMFFKWETLFILTNHKLWEMQYLYYYITFCSRSCCRSQCCYFII